jgi:hypothetical protein
MSERHGSASWALASQQYSGVQELQIIVCDQRAPAIKKPPLESRTAGFGRLTTLTPRATTSAPPSPTGSPQRIETRAYRGYKGEWLTATPTASAESDPTDPHLAKPSTPGQRRTRIDSLIASTDGPITTRGELRLEQHLASIR